MTTTNGWLESTVTAFYDVDVVQYGHTYSKYEGWRQDLVGCAYQDGQWMCLRNSPRIGWASAKASSTVSSGTKARTGIILMPRLNCSPSMTSAEDHFPGLYGNHTVLGGKSSPWYHHQAILLGQHSVRLIPRNLSSRFWDEVLALNSEVAGTSRSMYLQSCLVVKRRHMP